MDSHLPVSIVEPFDPSFPSFCATFGCPNCTMRSLSVNHRFPHMQFHPDDRRSAAQACPVRTKGRFWLSPVVVRAASSSGGNGLDRRRDLISSLS
jgi:hypothetical protein